MSDTHIDKLQLIIANLEVTLSNGDNHSTEKGLFMNSNKGHKIGWLWDECWFIMQVKVVQLFKVCRWLICGRLVELCVGGGVWQNGTRLTVAAGRRLCGPVDKDDPTTGKAHDTAFTKHCHLPHTPNNHPHYWIPVGCTKFTFNFEIIYLWITLTQENAR